jgi:hypothetical protein
MVDRNKKTMLHAVDDATVVADQVIYSDIINTFDFIYAGLMIEVSGSGSGGLTVGMEVSPDQGTHWFDLVDNLSGSPALPASFAFGGIALPASWTRVKVTGASNLTNSYQVSVWFMGYR